MAFKIRSGIPTKSYVIRVDRAGARRHFDLMTEFIEREFESPRSGGSAPVRGKEGISDIHFHLHTALVEEYERRMAEPYPRIPRKKDTPASD